MKEKQGFNLKMDCSAQYYALDRDKKRLLRNLFIQRTGISHPGFYAKVRRRCWSFLETDVFNNIMTQLNNGAEKC